jgi:hypothetical protein
MFWGSPENMWIVVGYRIFSRFWYWKLIWLWTGLSYTPFPMALLWCKTHCCHSTSYFVAIQHPTLLPINIPHYCQSTSHTIANQHPWSTSFPPPTPPPLSLQKNQCLLFIKWGYYNKGTLMMKCDKKQERKMVICNEIN